MRNAAKNAVGSLALVAVSLTIAGIAGEIVVRKFAPQRLESYRPIYEADPDLVYKLKRNYHAVYSQPEFVISEATNSIGMRDHEIGPKDPATLRILGLGDSFSYSNSVDLDSTFFKQIESSLRTERGAALLPGAVSANRTGHGVNSAVPAYHAVEVLNGAVPAYSTIQELRLYKKYGRALQPDIVLLGFYIGNDFQDSRELFDSTGVATIDVVDGTLHANSRFQGAMYDKQERTLRTSTMGIRAFFAEHSALYVFLRERFSESLWRLGLRNNPPPPEICARVLSPDMQKGWELEQRLLSEFASVTSRNHTRLIVLMLPTQYQVHEDLWKHHFTTFHLDPTAYDLDQPQRMLQGFCVRNGIEVIDALPHMREAGKAQSLFYPIASYMKPAGHKVVADIVVDYLRAHPTAPRPPMASTDQHEEAR